MTSVLTSLQRFYLEKVSYVAHLCCMKLIDEFPGQGLGPGI
jgi:hypothetical protein